MTLYEMIEDVKAEGISIGAQQKAYETAKNLILRGMDFDFVHDVTGLSYEQVESIADELDTEI